jgi:transcriptional regulator with XRE-family HTH domain
MEMRTTAEHDRIAFGEFLRQARERRRLTLEQIAGETKIAPRFLTSLEQGNVQPMPKGMYRRAMLRAYAESVGLDPKAALTEFERTFEERPPREAPLPTLPVPAPQQGIVRPTSRRRRGLAPAIAVLGLAMAIIVGVWWALTGDTEPAPTQTRSAAAPVTSGGTTETPPTTATTTSRVTPATPPPAALATSGTHAAPAAATPARETPATPLATEGQLVVTSEPPGARVTVNGIGWGTTPLTIRYLPLGHKRVRLTMSGYVSVERTVVVDGRRPSATVRVSLREQE